MSQTPAIDYSDTPTFDQMMRRFRGPSTGLTYTELVNPIDTTPPSLRVVRKVEPIPHEEKIVAELDAVRPESAPDDSYVDNSSTAWRRWPNYNQQLEEVSEKGQKAASVIFVRDRRGIALVETPHHFPTQAEKDAETAVTDEGLVIPPMPTERPKLSLVRSEGKHRPTTREERLGLPSRSPVKTLGERPERSPEAFHAGLLSLAEEKALGAVSGPYSGAQAFDPQDMPSTFAPIPITINLKPEDSEGLVDLMALARDAMDKDYTASLYAQVRDANRVIGRMDNYVLDGLHKAAERVRRIGTDQQDGYNQEPVQYVGSDTVEMAMPKAE